MNIGKIITNDLANGEGIRTSVFVSGCDHRCEGCHNKELWDYSFGVPLSDEIIEKIITSLGKDQIPKHLSILGGEPLMPQNRKGVLYLIQKIRKRIPSLNIWLWTGYEMKDLIKQESKTIFGILDNVDTLIDGKYIQSLKGGKHLWRGSSNQKIWYKNNNVFYVKEENKNV